MQGETTDDEGLELLPYCSACGGKYCGASLSQDPVSKEGVLLPSTYGLFQEFGPFLLTAESYDTDEYKQTGVPTPDTGSQPSCASKP